MDAIDGKMLSDQSVVEAFYCISGVGRHGIMDLRAHQGKAQHLNKPGQDIRFKSLRIAAFA
jgi:hypothetical protein